MNKRKFFEAKNTTINTNNKVHSISKSIFGICLCISNVLLFFIVCAYKWAAVTRHICMHIKNSMYTHFVQCTFTFRRKHVHNKSPTAKNIIILRILCVHDFIYSLYSTSMIWQYTGYVHINMNVNTHAHMIYVCKYTIWNLYDITKSTYNTLYLMSYTQVIDSVIRFFRLSRALLCTIFPRFDIFINVRVSGRREHKRETYFPVWVCSCVWA